VSNRAKLFEKDIPATFDNLLIAQHRDTLRYAHTRSGHFQPKLHRFEVGDLVYLRRQKADSLDSNVGRLILKVKEVLDSGRLVLEGRDKKTIKEHVEIALRATIRISLYGRIPDWLKGMWIKLAKSAIRLQGALTCSFVTSVTTAGT
jgi:hypothetical protein